MNKELFKEWRADVGLFCMGVCLLEVMITFLGINVELVELQYLFIGYGGATLAIAYAKSYYKNM
jgi:hypothetical protein